MSQAQKVTLFILRITMGWLFFWAGVTKLFNPLFSAEGYLKGAKSLTGFYAWLSTPGMLSLVNFLTEWGLTIIGILLILGIAVRLSGWIGALMMLLFYFPILDFPYPDAHSLIVDDHIIYAAALLVLAAYRAGRVWGLEHWCTQLPVCKQYPRLRSWLG